MGDELAHMSYIHNNIYLIFDVTYRKIATKLYQFDFTGKLCIKFQVGLYLCRIVGGNTLYMVFQDD